MVRTRTFFDAARQRVVAVAWWQCGGSTVDDGIPSVGLTAAVWGGLLYPTRFEATRRDESIRPPSRTSQPHRPDDGWKQTGRHVGSLP